MTTKTEWNFSQHPALACFPTQMHANWQWWDICKHAKTMELDHIQPTLSPIIRMVDHFFKNRNLGLLFEAKVGKGKLLVCSADLKEGLESRPVARQLHYSLMRYMQSESFDPVVSVSFSQIEKALYSKGKVEEKKVSIYGD